MRSLSGLVAVAAITMVFLLASPARAERVCVPHGDCFTAECWAIPGGRRCRRVCPKRCYDDSSRYFVPGRRRDPEQASRYVAPQPPYHPYTEQPPFDAGPLLALLVVGFLIAVAIVGASQGTSIDSEIEEALQSAASARTLAREASNKVEEIDSVISSAEREAFASGRKAADKEWKDWTHE